MLHGLAPFGGPLGGSLKEEMRRENLITQKLFKFWIYIVNRNAFNRWTLISVTLKLALLLLHAFISSVSRFHSHLCTHQMGMITIIKMETKMKSICQGEMKPCNSISDSSRDSEMKGHLLKAFLLIILIQNLKSSCVIKFYRPISSLRLLRNGPPNGANRWNNSDSTHSLSIISKVRVCTIRKAYRQHSSERYSGKKKSCLAYLICKIL